MQEIFSSSPISYSGKVKNVTRSPMNTRQRRFTKEILEQEKRNKKKKDQKRDFEESGIDNNVKEGDEDDKRYGSGKGKTNHSPERLVDIVI